MRPEFMDWAIVPTAVATDEFRLNQIATVIDDTSRAPRVAYINNIFLRFLFVFLTRIPFFFK